MGILTTLRQDRAGEWSNLDDYLRELRHRESAAVAALANALSAPSADQVELASTPDGAAALLEIACDLRMPKGSRLAATRCLLEAGIEGPHVGHLFIGAGDLVTDPRLGGGARKLVEAGVPAALRLGGDVAAITLTAGAFARAVQAGASAVGQAKVKDLLQDAPELHAGAIAAQFALGLADLPEGHRTGWKRLLQQTCAANRRAPAAARRVGLAPPWPPNFPDAFGSMIKEAEQESATIASADAVSNPAALKKQSPPPAVARAAPPSPRPAEREPSGKTLGPPIRRSPLRQPAATAADAPVMLPPKAMQPVTSRAPAAPPPPRPAAPELRLDPRGRRIPRADRWSEDKYEWEAPVLPSSDLPPPAKAQVAPGPFAARLQSLFEDRPEAVDRLLGAAEALGAVRGEEALFAELAAEMSRKVWQDRKLPPEQVRRLRAVAHAESQPAAWRTVAARVLEKFAFFVSGGA